MTHAPDDWRPPIHADPILLAQTVAMTPSLSESTRHEVIEMLHELTERRQHNQW
jgi:hypothetical protein